MAQQSSGQFFAPWEPPPAFAEPPGDQALEQRISKLAEFAGKNGPPFVDVLRQKQRNNPDYAFLTDGLGSQYFRWRLYCLLFNLNPDQPLDAHAQAPHQGQPLGVSSGQRSVPSDQPFALDPRQSLEEALRRLPPDIDQAFSAVLGKLSGTRTSIKESKEWFMASIQHAPGLAAKMAFHQEQLPAYDRQLHVLYLANDVLLKGLLQRDDSSNAEADPVASAFRNALPGMLHSAYRAGGALPEVEQRLTTIIDHWGSRAVYPEQYIAELKRVMVEGLPPPLPHPTPHQPGIPGGMRPPGQWHPPAQPGISRGPEPWQQPMHAMHQPQMPPSGPGPFIPQHMPYQQLPPQIPQGPPMWDGGPPPARPFFPEDPSMGFLPGYGPPVGQPGMMPPRGFQGGPPSGPPLPHTGMGLQQPQAMPGWGGPPPHGQSFPPGGALPSAGPPGPAQPEELPTDPMGFPPGLLPTLVEEHLKTEENYVPLTKRDVEAAGIPEASEPTSYLLARLDRLYAEIQDYRPGISRADLEDDQRRQRTKDALGSSRPILASSKDPLPSDGSFKGQGAQYLDRIEISNAGERKQGGPAGLGFGNVEAEREESHDPFSQYRRKRSGFYHEAITRATATANEPQPVT